MKKITLMMSLILSATLCFAQNNNPALSQTDRAGNWFKPSLTNVITDRFFETNRSQLGLTAEDELRLKSVKTDEIGMEHARYQQYHKNVKVEGAEFILHSKNNLVKSANGRLVKNILANANAQLSFEQALNSAKAVLNAPSYFWESAEKESLIKDLRNDASATFYPKKELVYMAPNWTQNGEQYQLAYKLDLYYEGEHDHAILFIDALSGELLLQLDGCHTGNSNGTAVTKYHGTQSIVTDSISANSFELRDLTHGNGIETFNAKNSTSTQLSVIFEDTDNYWDNVNAQVDEAATDVHWSSAQFYDYYLTTHNRSSYDDQGGKIRSYVHWDNGLFNASWNGVYAVYGDGNGNPLTSIDVIGHELTHGVTGNSADLIYAYESGALNESFSDIFGTAIEHFALGSNADWDIGLLDFKLRSMSNPKSFGNPNTYKGAFWEFTAADNGGVHTNSGVQNYWFYLLCEGGSGINDNNNNYQVDSIGMDIAGKIAYRNLVYYLTPSSNYLDARRGSIQAAEDLFGACSYEVHQVSKAWHAVGIGSDTLTNDFEVMSVLSPFSGCNLTNAEDIGFSFKYYRSGCDSVILAGDSVEVGYQIAGGNPVVEKLIFTNNVNSGSTLNYTFNQKANLASGGAYSIHFWVDYRTDYYKDNDSLLHNFTSTQPINTVQTIGFEPLNKPVEDGLYFPVSNVNSTIQVSSIARNTGIAGLGMSATDGDLFNLGNIIPPDEALNFTVNPEFGAKICICVDATNWENVSLAFDLKQTYSGIYKQFAGFDPPELVSSFRVTVNGNQIGNQYHPVTNFSDPFVRHFINLDQYKGQAFELCMESKNFIGRDEDFTNSVGDNTYLDNINIFNTSFIGVDENPIQQLNVYPNPSNGIVVLDLSSVRTGELNLKVTNALGANILTTSQEALKGTQKLTLDLSHVEKGIYFIQIEQEGFNTTKKLIIQ